MEPIHELSSVAALPEFDLWGVPPTQVTVERDIEIEYRPLAAVDGKSPIQFSFTSSPDEYIKLDSMKLYWVIQLKLSRDDKKAIVKDDWKNVTFCNNTQSSMIDSINLCINNQQVFHLPQHYGYRAYLDCLLGMSDDAKLSHLSSSMWEESQENQTAIIEPQKDSDLSSEIEMFGKIHTDLNFQGRALIGGCKIDLDVNLKKPEFYIKLEKGYSIKVDVKDVILYVHKAKTSNMLVDAHRKALSMSPVKYPITRIEIKQQSIGTGISDVLIDNYITGQMPRRMFVFMVPNSAFNGSFEKNPFDFKHFDINYLAAYIDGIQYPTRPYMPKFSSRKYLREYVGLYEALNQNGTDTYYKQHRNKYPAKPIFGFNFAADLSDGCGMIGHVNPIKRGTLRLVMKFDKPLPEVINVVAYCEYDNIIEIHSDGSVLNSQNYGLSSNQ